VRLAAASTGTERRLSGGWPGRQPGVHVLLLQQRPRLRRRHRPRWRLDPPDHRRGAERPGRPLIMNTGVTAPAPSRHGCRTRPMPSPAPGTGPRQAGARRQQPPSPRRLPVWHARASRAVRRSAAQRAGDTDRWGGRPQGRGQRRRDGGAGTGRRRHRVRRHIAVRAVPAPLARPGPGPELLTRRTGRRRAQGRPARGLRLDQEWRAPSPTGERRPV
jgi:hypothetical protein